MLRCVAVLHGRRTKLLSRQGGQERLRVWSDQLSVVLATPVCVFCNVRYILFRLPFVSSRRSQPLSYTHRSPLDVVDISGQVLDLYDVCLLYTSPSPRD